MNFICDRISVSLLLSGDSRMSLYTCVLSSISVRKLSQQKAQKTFTAVMLKIALSLLNQVINISGQVTSVLTIKMNSNTQIVMQLFVIFMIWNIIQTLGMKMRC